MVTLIVTALLAMFANGEQTQLQAELQQRAARNRLMQTEAAKLGTRKFVAQARVSNEQSGVGYEKLNDASEVGGRPGGASAQMGGGAALVPGPQVSETAPWTGPVPVNSPEWFANRNKRFRPTAAQIAELRAKMNARKAAQRAADPGP